MKDKHVGVIVGLAVGDALGAPVEFMRRAQILDVYGPNGIRDYTWVPARYTDDTQMSLATAWGLIECAGDLSAYTRVNACVWMKYQEWLMTQDDPDQRRAPGATCLTALEDGIMGSHMNRINESKGCGGVMRVAPAGLFFPPGLAFTSGLNFAAMTHTHPTGYLAAGYLAELISNLVRGEGLGTAMRLAHGCMVTFDRKGSGETLEILARVEDTPAGQIQDLGEGWVAEEALAIALHAVIHAQSFEEAVLSAVNITGDSDSTGSIAGAISGASFGYAGIPRHWALGVESAGMLRKIAVLLYERRIRS